MVNGDQATIIGVGTVTVTATKAESGNYKAATATGIIIITKAPAPAITYPTAADSITYGQKIIRLRPDRGQYGVWDICMGKRQYDSDCG